ncbi:hypothetical protein ARMGADRAFT_750930 [Armillaria gallica]|uniref:Uncharacterized protein n=1 Tax=Armillaria gallica TaxID=47427 RepID=A0A2H3E890_ARMGA|nr:hypothetical protein ARMGADRAFT_750930 [Armillaria gallica]
MNLTPPSYFPRQHTRKPIVGSMQDDLSRDFSVKSLPSLTSTTASEETLMGLRQGLGGRQVSSGNESQRKFNAANL